MTMERVTTDAAPSNRIAVLAGNSVHNDARITREARALHRAGYAVQIFGLSDDTWPPGKYVMPDGVLLQLSGPSRNSDENYGRKYTESTRGVFYRFRGSIDTFRITRLVRKWFAMRHAARAISAWRPDAIHGHDAVTLPTACRLGRRLHCPIVFDAHEIYEDSPQAPIWLKCIYRGTLKRFQGQVSHFITISTRIGQYYRRKYPNLPRALIVKNAAALPDPFEYDGRLHDAAGLPRDQRIALFHGGLTGRRGLHDLIRATKDLSPQWTLVVMGSGPLEAELLELAAREANLRDGAPQPPAVVFLPPVPQPELVHWTAGASLGFVNYERTGLNHLFCTPNKLWEYPSAGVPIVCSDLVELRRTVCEHQIGWILPRAASPTQIAAFVNDLGDIELNRARDSCQAFIARDNFDVYAQKLTGLYNMIFRH